MQKTQKGSYWKKSILFAIPLLFTLIICSSSYGKDKINLGLTGRFQLQNRGNINCVDTFLDQSQNEYVFCGTKRGLLVFDISNKENPTQKAFLEIGNVNDIAFIHSRYVILAMGEKGVYIIDIGNPKKPGYTVSYDTPGDAKGVAVSDNYAFVADGDNGLLIIDCSNPSVPIRVSGINTPTTANAVDIYGKYALVAYGSEGNFSYFPYLKFTPSTGGLVIIDWTHPSNPVFIGEYDTSGLTKDVAAIKNYAFVTYKSTNPAESGLVIIDWSDPNNPVNAGKYITSSFNAMGVAVSGNYAYVADGYKGLIIIDYSDPNGPIYNTSWHACDVAASGDYAYVVDEDKGLAIIDCSNPASPLYCGGFDTSGYARSVAVSGNYAYIADSVKGLVIIDWRYPNNPLYCGGFDTSVHDVTVSGDYAFVTDGGVLSIIDCSNPNTPVLAGVFDPNGNVSDIAISGDYAFVTDREGLSIIDCSNPNTPVLTGVFDLNIDVDVFGLNRYVHDIAISGDYAFVTDGGGLSVIDCSNPNTPVLAGVFEPDPNGNFVDALASVAVSGDYAFGIQSSLILPLLTQFYWLYSLLIIDCSNPNNPVLTGRFDIPGDASSVAVSGNHAFVADGDNGVVIIDWSDPANPIYAGSFDTSGYASDVVVYGDYVFVADGDNGLLIFLIIDTPPEQGNLILCPSSPVSEIDPLWEPSQSLANMAYSTFLDKNYPSYFTYYISPSLYEDIDKDGIFDPMTVDDFDPEAIDTNYALTDWAYNRLNTGPLYLYFTGMGAQDTFQVSPGQIIKSLNPDDPNITLKNYIDFFQRESNRDVICLLEFSSSGSFCNDLIDTNTNPYSRTIITCTDEGISYLDRSGLKSFTGHLLALFRDVNYASPGLFEDTGISDYERVSLLQSLFSKARETFWDQGDPFSSQPPQMVTARGPRTLTSISIKADRLLSTIPDPNTLAITDPNESITLKVIGHYLRGQRRLDPNELYFQSSDEDILLVDQNGRVIPNRDNRFNGEATIFATIIDPNFIQSPDHDSDLPPLGGVTGRIPITVDISEDLEWKEKDNLPWAIIVAGEKNEGDGIWEEINTVSQYAYRTLLSRGYSRTRIKFLTHLKEELTLDDDPKNDYATDLDGDKDPNNDIDGIPTLQNLWAAIDQAGTEGAESLTLFLVDHGSGGGIYLNPNELLIPQDLMGELQKNTEDIQVNLIIESCHSGLFIDALQEIEDPNRIIIITSTDSQETSYLISGGLVSFSHYLFTFLQSGASFKSAFERAYLAMFGVDPAFTMYGIDPAFTMYGINPAFTMYGINPAFAMYGINPAFAMYGINPAFAMYGINPAFAMYGRINPSLYDKGQELLKELLQSLNYPLAYQQSEVSFASASERARLPMDLLLDKDWEEPYQNPQLYNYPLAEKTALGKDFLISQDQPVITSSEILPDPNISVNEEITIRVKASDLDGIEEVWALVNASYSQPVFSGDLERPVVDLPRIDFEDKGEYYEGTYATFLYEGIYSLLVFAKDKKGNVSLPYKLSISVQGDTLTKALFVAGGDTDLNCVFSHANWVLEQKGIETEILSPRDPNTLKGRLKHLSGDASILFLYLIGQTDQDPNGITCFKLNDQYNLYPDTLDEWLNGLKDPNDLPCLHILLMDTPRASDFIRLIRLSPNRISIAGASSDIVSFCEKKGNLAFSDFFFTCIFSGISIFQAYEKSRDAVQYDNPEQKPWLEDRGSEQDSWGQLAKAIYLGSPFEIKTAKPMLRVPKSQCVLKGEETIFWADTLPNAKVWAIVKSKNFKDKLDFSEIEKGHYEASYSFDTLGFYEVTTYVKDQNGLLDYKKSVYAVRPFYVNVPEGNIVQGRTTIWAEINFDPNLSETHGSNVWADIYTPYNKRIVKHLTFNRNKGRYDTSYNFNYPGHYTVRTYLKTQTKYGQICNEMSNYVAMDAYDDLNEPDDDNPEHATFVHIEDDINHIHNFHNPEDEDWVKFFLIKERYIHEIRIEKVEEWDGEYLKYNQWDSNCHLMLDLCDLDGNLVLDSDTNLPVLHNVEITEPVADTSISFDSSGLPRSDFYLLRFYYGCSEIPPETSTTYKIKKIHVPDAGTQTGHIFGYIKNNPVSGKVHFEREDCNTILLDSDPNKGGIYYGIDLDTGKYKVFASGDCYKNSRKYDIKVEKDSLTQKDFFLEWDGNDLNCGAPPLSYSQSEVHLSFHTGMNLFKGPCDYSDCNSDCFIDEIYSRLKNFYKAIDPNFNVSMSIKGHDPESRQWYVSFMDGDKTINSCNGDIFTIDSNQTYLFYLDIQDQDPNQNLKEICLPFYCSTKNSPDFTKGYNFYRGINLSGLYKPYEAYNVYNSFKILLENPNIRDKISSILFYDSQKGDFHAYYNLFGRPCADIPQSETNNGYIIYTEEEVHDWKP